MSVLLALLPWCAVLAISQVPPAALKRLAFTVALTSFVLAPLAALLGNGLSQTLSALELLLWLGLVLGCAKIAQHLTQLSVLELLQNGWLIALSLISLRSSLDLSQALLLGVLAGLGFAAFVLSLQALYQSLDQTRLAPALRGTPILLISAALMGLPLFALPGFGVL